MVSYELPKPPLGILARARESVRLATAFFKGDRTTIRDITSETQFSPLQPIRPPAPYISGRAFDYMPGYNVQIFPRGYSDGRIPFWQLHNAARTCEILRLGLETVKDQICGVDWQITPREDADVDQDDPRIAKLTAFFQKPDGITPFQHWLRQLLEEFLVTDAVSILRVKDRVGNPHSFELIDGQTIKVLIDEDGRRPLPPSPAYEQVLKGMVRNMFTTEELLYLPRNLLPDKPIYGYSIVEQVLITARTSIERQKYQLSEFTEGAVPDSFMEFPEGMTPDAIKAFEERFNDILSGNARERKRVPGLPAGAKINRLKETILKDDFDEWIARIICFALGLAPTAFIKQMNRSTSENDKERAQEEGQAPKMQYLKLIMDTLIADFGEEFSTLFEFTWKESINLDPTIQANNAKTYAQAAVKTINEVRAELGLDPRPEPEADKLMALTATGYVPLDSFEQNQQLQQQNMKAVADAKAQNQTNGTQNKSPAEQNVAGKSAYSRLDKAVRRTANPFESHT